MRSRPSQKRIEIIRSRKAKITDRPEVYISSKLKSLSYLAVCRVSVGWLAHRPPCRRSRSTRYGAVRRTRSNSHFTANSSGSSSSSASSASTAKTERGHRHNDPPLILLLLARSLARSLLPPPLHHLLHTKRPQFIFLVPPLRPSAMDTAFTREGEGE